MTVSSRVRVLSPLQEEAIRELRRRDDSAGQLRKQARQRTRQARRKNR